MNFGCFGILPETAPGGVGDDFGWDRPRQTRRWSELVLFNIRKNKEI
jgi:hypothetical protein